MNGKQYSEALPYPRLNYEPLKRIVPTAEILAEKIGVTTTVVHKWIERGLPFFKADMVAIKLGYHPVEIWYDWFDIQTVEPMKSHSWKSKTN